MGNNLEYKDIQDIFKKLGAKEQNKPGPSDAEVKRDWNKLAGALRGL